MGRRIRAGVFGALAIAAVTLGKAAVPGLPAVVTAVSFDVYQRLSPRKPADTPVRVVDIDEASLRDIGQWPWPRTRLARLTERLFELGAATVAFDIIFAEPDASSPERVAAALPLADEADRERLRGLLGSLPNHDRVFAAAMEGTPVVLGFSLTAQGTGRTPLAKAGVAYAGEDPAAILQPFEGTVTALPVLQAAAAGEGSIGLSRYDTGGIIRRAPMIVSDGRRVYPSLAVEALRVAQGASSLTVRSTGASGEAGSGAPAIVDMKVGALEVPLTRDGELWLHYDRDRPERYVSAASLLAEGGDDEALRARIKDHIVFVGSSAAGLLDIRSTPLGENVPGVSVHAQVAEQVLEGTFIRRPDWAPGLEEVATILFCALVIGLLLTLDASLALAVISGVMIVIVGGAWLSFSRYGLLLEPILPSLTAGTIFAAVLGFLYFSGDREKRFIRHAFGQYIEPELVRKLEESPKALKLGGETRTVSIMFMDIRGFTPISEGLTADELVTFLNQLLSPLSDAILREHGTIDKYIGDSIMAFWNAPLEVPNHELHACRAALLMQAALTEMNARDAFGFRARRVATDTVRIGIGINTGQACVGNVGSARRFNYSVVGDSVNVAARLEASCKEVGTDILISEETARAAPTMAILEAGWVELKGKSQRQRLFAVVGDEKDALLPSFTEIRVLHRELIDHLDAGRGREARDLLGTCRTLGGERLAVFYDRLENRRASEFAVA